METNDGSKRLIFRPETYSIITSKRPLSLMISFVKTMARDLSIDSGLKLEKT